MSAGAFRERLVEASAELRENRGRASLQALGVVLGVASVLGGFAINDSMRQQADRLFVRFGGLEKLRVYPNPIVKGGQPTALQAANLGLLSADAAGGEALDPAAVAGVSVRRFDRVLVKSPATVQDRQVTGIGADFIPMEGYALAAGRGFTHSELETGAPVAILGTQAADSFFPTGSPVGQTLNLRGIPVTVVGTFQYRLFRFREGAENIFSWENRIIALPAAFVQKRLQGDPNLRLDQVAFKLPRAGDLMEFSRTLTGMLRTSHRMQTDFRLDDVAVRDLQEVSALVRGRVRQAHHGIEDVEVKNLDAEAARSYQTFLGQIRGWKIVFLSLAGTVVLVGGVGVLSVMLISCSDRRYEIGLRKALGASDQEILVQFLLEAAVLGALGALAGTVAGAVLCQALSGRFPYGLVVDPFGLAMAWVVALVLALVFGLYPALRAMRLSPMEAMR